MQRLIRRYILKEIAIPFGMVLSVLTFVLLMGKILQVMDLLVNKGVRFLDIARLMLCLVPSFLVFTLPIALLIAILIGIGRLSGDNEITVLKSAGVSFHSLSVPVFQAALAAFLLTAITSLFLVPYGNWASRQLLYEMARQKASAGIRERVFIDDFRGILLYAEKIPVQGDFLEGVLISDNRISREPSTILARKAYLISDPDTQAVILRLEDGSTHTVDAGLNHYRKVDFRLYDIRLDLASSFDAAGNNGGKNSTEMTLRELAVALARTGIHDESSREMAIELHKKLTIPVSCLVFALLGLPLGIRPQRAVRSRGFTLGLCIVLSYYLLRLIGEALVETGKIGPLIGAWTPNLVFAAAGLWLFRAAATERSPLAFGKGAAAGGVAPLAGSGQDQGGRRSNPPTAGPSGDPPGGEAA